MGAASRARQGLGPPLISESSRSVGGIVAVDMRLSREDVIGHRTGLSGRGEGNSLPGSWVQGRRRKAHQIQRQLTTLTPLTRLDQALGRGCDTASETSSVAVGVEKRCRVRRTARKRRWSLPTQPDGPESPDSRVDRAQDHVGAPDG